MNHREEVSSALAGERVDRVVAMVAGVSRAVAGSLVDAGAVRRNGEACTQRSQRLEAGDVLEVRSPEPETDGPRADPAVDFAVLHEDPDVVVIDKPPALVVHAGAGHPHGTLVDGLLARYPEIADVGDPQRPGIVHRLDRDTSGLLVVARSQAAYDPLVAALAARRVERRYLAMVWGHPASPRGVIDAPIGRSAREPTRMAVVAGGREARTGYEVERTFDDPSAVALLRCRLETGRTHQIRVHLSSIGHPIVGDARYGGVREALDCPRPFLHATSLAFEHPVTGARMAFESPLPADLRAVLATLT
jgi:23S rRNA pseudouridine1911/1915/1917 synthase